MQPITAASTWLLRWPRAVPITLVVIWIAVLHGLSWLPRPKSIGEPSFGASILHNWMHAPVYAALAVWFALALRRSSCATLKTRDWLIAFFAAGLVGMSDEWHQALVPWRDGDPIDWMTDLLGAASALWICRDAWAGKPEPRLALEALLALLVTLSSAALAASMA